MQLHQKIQIKTLFELELKVHLAQQPQQQNAITYCWHIGAFSRDAWRFEKRNSLSKLSASLAWQNVFVSFMHLSSLGAIFDTWSRRRFSWVGHRTRQTTWYTIYLQIFFLNIAQLVELLRWLKRYIHKFLRWLNSYATVPSRPYYYLTAQVKFCAIYIFRRILFNDCVCLGLIFLWF